MCVCVYENEKRLTGRVVVLRVGQVHVEHVAVELNNLHDLGERVLELELVESDAYHLGLLGVLGVFGEVVEQALVDHLTQLGLLDLRLADARLAQASHHAAVKHRMQVRVQVVVENEEHLLVHVELHDGQLEGELVERKILIVPVNV